MKIPVFALLLVIALAACRDRDPDDAPPVGLAGVAAASAPTQPAIVAAEPVLVPSKLALDVEQRAKLYRRATAEAREELDVAWNRCGSLDGEPFVRCRDEAVVLYDQAMNRARARFGDDLDERGVMVPGTLDNPDAIAAIQVTGTRG